MLLSGLTGLSLLAAGRCFAADHDGMDMGGMSMGGAHHDHATTTAFGEPYTGDKPARTIAITMGDVSFTPAHLDVKRGESVRFVVTNASALEHDFTLGDPATQADHRKDMAADMMAGHAAHHHHETNAVTVPPGATQSLAWMFSRPGTFEYDCNVPGHYEAGMAGTVTVAP